jgi:hypothetical protein
MSKTLEAIAELDRRGWLPEDARQTLVEKLPGLIERARFDEHDLALILQQWMPQISEHVAALEAEQLSARRSEAARKREAWKREQRDRIARNYANNGETPTPVRINRVTGGRIHSQRCIVCHDPFESVREDASYCSNACRQAGYRARRATA